MTPGFLSYKPKKSLRSILVIWFLLFSIIPIGFLTFYSIVKFKRAFDTELAQRLIGNGREVGIILNDFLLSLHQRKSRYLVDNSFLFSLSVQDVPNLKSITGAWMKSEISSSLSVYSRFGQQLLSTTRDARGQIHHRTPSPDQVVQIAEQNLNALKGSEQISFTTYDAPKAVNLFLVSKVHNKGKLVGYIEQKISLDGFFINKLKERLALEILIFKPNGTLTLASHKDFFLYDAEVYKEQIKNLGKNLFNLNLRGNPLGFVFTPIKWGNDDITLGLGGSKKDTEGALRNVNYAFYSVVGVIVLLLFFTILVTSSAVLKPLYDLIDAIRIFHDSSTPVEIPIKNDTEIGLLTAAFNEMSRKVFDARHELKNKIKELEQTNRDLRAAQTQLVQSTKMASLGQLVAGIAHELNNPIGFIFANMTHLRNYSEGLFKVIDMAHKDPQNLAKTEEEVELEYIRSDLPKLIKSCEEGARRTKDIVEGLRNFSRIQEAQVKDMDIEEALEITLNLLSGEIKNRIAVHKDFAKVPTITCFASQINQVFMNIISNAAQAIEGEGQIWVSTRSTVDSTGKVTGVSVSIQDTGKGISAEDMEKIFDPFFTTKDVGKGTGLGLSISYGIVQKHGGEIQVKSQVGVGTEFTIMLPLAAKI